LGSVTQADTVTSAKAAAAEVRRRDFLMASGLSQERITALACISEHECQANDGNRMMGRTTFATRASSSWRQYYEMAQAAFAKRAMSASGALL
jgi:hypothetical protein